MPNRTIPLTLSIAMLLAGYTSAARATESLEAEGTIKGEVVAYTSGELEFQGYLAYDESMKGARPGILIAHEWWGLNDYARQRADQLAGMGYTVLAMDMYGDGKTADHPEDAGKFSGALMADPDQVVRRFEAARAVLEAHETTDPDKTAAIGYCLGGAVVLHMARTGADLDLVASFHGLFGTRTPAEQGGIKAPLLVFHGEADPFVPASAAEAFQQEMADAGANLKFVSYPGVKHSFTNPGSTAAGEKFGVPLEYNEEADKASWADLSAGLEQAFATE